MSDSATCPHNDTVPVDVRSHETGATTTVARLCRACLAQLHPGWGCPNCDWQTVEFHRLCDPRCAPEHVLAHPCQEHT